MRVCRNASIVSHSQTQFEMIAADAYAIFERAREAFVAQRYPNTVAYTLTVDAVDGSGDKQQRHYHEYWDGADGSVAVKPPVSDEQLLHPYKPSAGVNFMGWNIGGPRVGSGVRDLIGVPMLAPNYSFGLSPYVPPSKLTPAQLVAQIRAQYHDPAPQKVDKLAQNSGLKTIAIVAASARAYRISLVGIEPDGNARDYHLSLQPVHDPLKYRLRDLWVDTQTYTLRRLRIGANFTDTATEGVPWTVRFAQSGGNTYITEEDAEKPISGYHGLMYSKYSVSFDIIPNGTMPSFAAWTSVSQPLIEPLTQ